MSTFIFKFSESINFMFKYIFHNLVIKKPNADFNIICLSSTDTENRTND